MRRETITQNAQYTFKYNSSLGRHGWLRLTPAYSVRLVEEILTELDYTPLCVMEPFSGTGTTELVCANKGIPSFALEINPFLVWLGNAKLGHYPSNKVEEFLSFANELMQNIEEYSPTELGQIISAAYPDENDAEQIRSRIRLTSKKTLINEFNHFEGNLSIFQPAIDITDQALGKERTDLITFISTL